MADRVTKKADLDTIYEMVLQTVGDLNDDALIATASIVLGRVERTASVTETTFDVHHGVFRPVPIETLFTAFQAFLLDTQRAGFNAHARAVARTQFQQAVGPLAYLIDWQDHAA